MMRASFLGIGAIVVCCLVGPTLWEAATFQGLAPDARVDRVLVDKSDRTLIVLRDGQPLKTYSVALGREPQGAKQFEGDHRTPEGVYTIDWRKADSAFHRALHVSYPSIRDTEFARSQGRQPGSAIMIHGIRNGLGLVRGLHRVVDWTDGCIAVTNREIEELWHAIPDGTPIEIRP
jgi:murein L,D-transpeptidase YafK